MLLSLLVLSCVSFAAPVTVEEPEVEILSRSGRDLIGYNRMQNNVNRFYSSHAGYHKHVYRHQPSFVNQLLHKAKPETKKYLKQYIRSLAK